MRNRWVLMGLLLTITAIFVVGCYTVLSHPGVKGEEEQAYSGSYYREHCTDCHADYHQYPYGYYYSYSPGWYWNYPNYGHYYMYPWWWDWYYGQPSGGGTTVPSERLEKSRRSLQPPYVPGGQGINPPALTQPNTSPGQIPGAVEGQKSQQPQQKEEKKEERQQEKIPKRTR
ncbi:MAG: hypothetical protein Q8O10_07810 [candidate division Zixibacteria bacterium]|nr:hypothetical protein [candidate division Zixibacteria bacterium]